MESIKKRRQQKYQSRPLYSSSPKCAATKYEWIAKDYQIPDNVTEQGGVVVHNKLLQKGFPFSVSGGSSPHAHLLGSQCPPPEERRLSMPETGEKERNCLFKSYTYLRVMT